jgi:hypothetical protein
MCGALCFFAAHNQRPDSARSCAVRGSQHDFIAISRNATHIPPIKKAGAFPAR